MKVLALGSHFDDVEIGCGGTLLKNRDQMESLHIAILKADEDRTGAPAIRSIEQDISCEMLRANKILFNSWESLGDIVSKLDEIGATVLYYPFPMDSHQDHGIASKVGAAVARNVYGSVFQYLGATSHSYYPNYLEVIDMDDKKELVSVFESQMIRKPKFMDVMEAQQRFFGSLIGNGHYAEGFVLVRHVNY